MNIAKKELPSEWVETISEQAELVNAPRIGVDDNTLFGNVQMNVASASGEEGLFYDMPELEDVSDDDVYLCSSL